MAGRVRRLAEAQSEGRKAMGLLQPPAMLLVRHCVGAPRHSTNVCIDVDGARSLHAGEGGHWVVARPPQRQTRTLATKFSAHKVSLLDINGDKGELFQVRSARPFSVSSGVKDGSGPEAASVPAGSSRSCTGHRCGQTIRCGASRCSAIAVPARPNCRQG
jgi:hypothetical protein